MANSNLISGSGSGSGFPIDGTRMGFIDYQDVATATTPISLPANGTFVNLTNDGAGAFSTNSAPQGVTDVWDTTNNEFNFQDLQVGDVVTVRVDLVVDPPANTEIKVDLLFFSGEPVEVPVLFSNTFFKNGGSGQKLLNYSSFYMGSQDVIDIPVKLRAAADGLTDVIVNGWFVTVFTKKPL